MGASAVGNKLSNAQPVTNLGETPREIVVGGLRILRSKRPVPTLVVLVPEMLIGAGEGTRTLDPLLGKHWGHSARGPDNSWATQLRNSSPAKSPDERH